MDRRFTNFTNPVKGFGFDGGTVLPSLEQSKWDFQFEKIRGNHIGSTILEQPSDACRFDRFFNMSSEVSFPEDQESYPVLSYINQMLMEENLEEQQNLPCDPLALQATEKSFYEVLGKDYPPPPPSREPLSGLDNVIKNPKGFTGNSPPNGHGQVDYIANANLNSSFFNDTDTLLQFKKGLEEGNKFLPAGRLLIIDLDQYKLPQKESEDMKAALANGKEEEEEHSGRDSGDLDSGRCNNQPAFDYDEVELAETFDRLWRASEVKGKIPCSESVFEQPGRSSKKLQQNQMLHGFNNSKDLTKRLYINGGSLDLRALLISSAQFVAAGDHKSANEQLKLIRQHTSLIGSADQRLAIYFANALEARMSGNVPDYFETMNSKFTSAAEELRAQRVNLCAPFRQIYAFFSNNMIMQAAAEATTLHIVDFGIGYGLQWPSFIQLLSKRPGGPPKLRMTGVGIPKPGFRPAERIEQTGRRLAKYCERFKVPFEFQAVAIRHWQRLRVEELKLAKNEFLAVNCQFRFQNLLDDQRGGEKDSKERILSLIREMNPDIVMTDVANGLFGGPFFLTRFREALFYFSALFDLVDQILPREDKHRIKHEQEFLGHEIMNVVACEGTARVGRPETYKQWEIRLKRAGFRLLHLDQDLMKELTSKVKAGYHNEFIICTDGNWVVQGWKGRAMTACCCFVPTQTLC